MVLPGRLIPKSMVGGGGPHLPCSKGQRGGSSWFGGKEKTWLTDVIPGTSARVGEHKSNPAQKQNPKHRKRSGAVAGPKKTGGTDATWRGGRGT